MTSILEQACLDIRYLGYFSNIWMRVAWFSWMLVTVSRGIHWGYEFFCSSEDWAFPHKKQLFGLENVDFVSRNMDMQF